MDVTEPAGVTRLKTIARGATALAVGAGAAHAVSFLTLPVVTRLYGPESFGLVSVILGAVGIVATCGTWRFDAALLLPPDDARGEWDATRLGHLATALSWLAAAAAALVMASVHLPFLDPLGRARWTIPLAVGLSGTALTLDALVLRDRSYRFAGGLLTLHRFATGIGQILLGLITPGASGLLFGFLGGTSLVVGLRVARLWRHAAGTARDYRALLRDYADFPRRGVANAVLTVTLLRYQVVLLPLFVAPRDVGLFAGAAALAMLPSTLLSAGLARVLQRELAPQAADRATTAATLRQTYGILLGIATLLVGAMAGTAWWMVPALLGEVWRPSAALLVAMTPLIWARFINSPFSVILVVHRRQTLLLYWQAATLTLSGGAFAAGFGMGLDLVRVTWLVSAVTACAYFAVYPIARRVLAEVQSRDQATPSTAAGVEVRFTNEVAASARHRTEMKETDVIFLAPVGGEGGIGSLTLAFMRRPSLNRWCFIDSARSNPISSDGLFTRVRKYLAHDLRVRWTFAQMLHRHRQAVAWFAVSSGPGFKLRDLPFAVYAARLGHGVVIQLHGGKPRGFLGSGPTGRVVRWCLGHAHVIVATNRDIHQAIHNAGLGRAGVLLPNPIELDEGRWHGHQAGPVLLVAQQRAEKGSLVAIEALAKLPGARLRLVGPCSGRNRQDIVRTSERCGVADRVEIVGRLARHEDVREEMKRASVLILPSASEGFPMAVLEAMALGVPVVATDVGAIPDMLGRGPDQAGILVPFTGAAKRPCDPEALGAAIAKVRGNAELARRLSDRALVAVRQYDFDRIEPALHDLVGRAAEARRSPERCTRDGSLAEPKQPHGR